MYELLKAKKRRIYFKKKHNTQIDSCCNILQRIACENTTRNSERLQLIIANYIEVYSTILYEKSTIQQAKKVHLSKVMPLLHALVFRSIYRRIDNNEFVTLRLHSMSVSIYEGF